MLNTVIARARRGVSNVLARLTAPPPPEGAALTSMLLPNGRFVLVLSGATRAVDTSPDLLGEVQDRTGAVAFLVFAEPLTVLDATTILGEAGASPDQSGEQR